MGLENAGNHLVRKVEAHAFYLIVWLLGLFSPFLSRMLLGSLLASWVMIDTGGGWS